MDRGQGRRLATTVAAMVGLTAACGSGPAARDDGGAPADADDGGIADEADSAEDVAAADDGVMDDEATGEDDATVEDDAAGEDDATADASRARLEPPAGRVYHGASPTPSVVDGYVVALGDPAIEPLVEGAHMGLPGTRPASLVGNVSLFLERVRAAGRVPHLSLGMDAGDGVPADDEIASTAAHDALIDAVAAVVAGYDGPLFIRIGFEFNGDWNAYTPGVYPLAYRKIVDRFRAAGVDEAAYVWCYEPDAPSDFDAEIMGEPAWYPGDEYVDWFGLDLFGDDDFDPAAAGGPGRETSYDRSVLFLQMAVDHRKPVILSETAAVRVYVTPDAGDPGLVDGRSDWETWFAKFFDFIGAHPEIRGFLYMNQDYRGTVYDTRLGWGDARIEVNSYILTQYVEVMNEERFVHRAEGLFLP